KTKAIIASVATAVIVGCTMLGLWLGGVFDRNGDSGTGTGTGSGGGQPTGLLAQMLGTWKLVFDGFADEPYGPFGDVWTFTATTFTVYTPDEGTDVFESWVLKPGTHLIEFENCGHCDCGFHGTLAELFSLTEASMFVGFPHEGDYAFEVGAVRIEDGRLIFYWGEDDDETFDFFIFERVGHGGDYSPLELNLMNGVWSFYDVWGDPGFDAWQFDFLANGEFRFRVVVDGVLGTNNWGAWHTGSWSVDGDALTLESAVSFTHNNTHDIVVSGNSLYIHSGFLTYWFVDVLVRNGTTPIC
ncbi:MAG: hypothetical protein FWC00_02420, partial [Firmicutes bacterium]|nr:hypothetical protein [Bacillota bacterium]